jgi:hypothetical protein
MTFENKLDAALEIYIESYKGSLPRKKVVLNWLCDSFAIDTPVAAKAITMWELTHDTRLPTWERRSACTPPSPRYLDNNAEF